MEIPVGDTLTSTAGLANSPPLILSINNPPAFNYDLLKIKPQNRKILIWPNELLKLQAAPVVNFNDELKQLIMDMLLTMRQKNGIGLAAPQVGVLQRVIVIEVPQSSPFALVNPEIIKIGDKKLIFNEGCLSTPGYFEMRDRPQQIFVKYNTEMGNQHTIEFQGIHAFAIQHEIDHLNGKVFVDGLSRLKTDRIKSKIAKTIKTGR